MIDAACPLKKFGPFRLASRFPRGCEFESSKTAITVRYPQLGGSRNDVKWSGRVSAAITIGAHEDGRSLTFDAAVENHSRALLP